MTRKTTRVHHIKKEIFMEFKAFLIKYAEIGQIPAIPNTWLKLSTASSKSYSSLACTKIRPDSFLIEKFPTGFNAYFI